MSFSFIRKKQSVTTTQEGHNDKIETQNVITVTKYRPTITIHYYNYKEAVEILALCFGQI